MERIQAVCQNVLNSVREGHQMVVVVSAMSGETNRLIELAKDISPSPSNRELDTLVTTGEQVTIALLSMALMEAGQPARSFTGFQIPIRTDSVHSKARIEDIGTERLRATLDAGQVAVVAGFQAVDESMNITTLGRGGSDTTAVALAAALQADFLVVG